MPDQKPPPLDVSTVTRFMEDHLSKSGELPDPVRYFGLHIGPSRSPMLKTLATLPGKILLITSGKYTTAIRNKNIDVVTCENWEDLRKTLFFLDQASHEYDSVAIDDLGHIQQFDIAAVLLKFKSDLMEAGYWSVTAEHMNLIVAWLRTLTLPPLSMNVAVSCLEKDIMDGEHIVQRAPDLVGSFQRSVASHFDVVVYHTTRELKPKKGAEVGEVEHRVLAQPRGERNLATDDWGVLEGIESPDIAVWLDRIEKSLTDAKEAKTKAAPKSKAKAKGKAKTKAAAKKTAEAEEEPPKDEEKAPQEPPEHAEEPDGGTVVVETPENGKSLLERAEDLQASFAKFALDAPHLEDQAIEVLMGAIQKVGYQKVGEIVEAKDKIGMAAVEKAWNEYHDKATEVG